MYAVRFDMMPDLEWVPVFSTYAETKEWVMRQYRNFLTTRRNDRAYWPSADEAWRHFDYLQGIEEFVTVKKIVIDTSDDVYKEEDDA